MNQRAQIQLLAANGSEMTVLGQTPLYLQHKDKTTVTFAIVARGVSHQALISWHDLKYLGVIPSNFPEAKCSAVTTSQIREQILAAYPTDSTSDEFMQSTGTSPLDSRASCTYLV